MKFWDEANGFIVGNIFIYLLGLFVNLLTS